MAQSAAEGPAELPPRLEDLLRAAMSERQLDLNVAHRILSTILTEEAEVYRARIVDILEEAVDANSS